MIRCVVNPVVFTKTKLPYGWLGNMSPYPVVWEGEEYRTAEALFQAMRFEDGWIRQEIRDQKSPMFAKMVAKQFSSQMRVEPTSADDVGNMEICLRLKIEQHQILVPTLLETEDRVIIEDVSNRAYARNLFWGMALFAPGSWKGQNTLGNLWMKIREDLKDV